MNAKDLGNMIRKKNNEMDNVLDPRVDVFIEQFQEAISNVYSNGKGYKYVACKRVGIAIEDVDLEDFSTIKFSVDYCILAGSEDFEKDHAMMTYWDFINQPYDEWQKKELAGRIYYEIYDLRYLVSEFEKRGFKCYADINNYKLVVAFEV